LAKESGEIIAVNMSLGQSSMSPQEQPTWRWRRASPLSRRSTEFDLSPAMLELQRRRSDAGKLDHKIAVEEGSAEQLRSG